MPSSSTQNNMHIGLMPVSKEILINPRVTAGRTGATSSAQRTGSGNSSGGGDGYACSGGGGGGGAAVDPIDNLNGLIANLYKTTFAPKTVAFAEQSESDLAAKISEWLLPGYTQAISERQEQTRAYGAALDADAIARGMGASTFVTDVKSRQQRDEARDIAVLKSEYGATLAKNVSEQLLAGQQSKLQADMFNVESAQAAYQLAYEAAALLMARGAVYRPEEDDDDK